MASSLLCRKLKQQPITISTNTAFPFILTTPNQPQAHTYPIHRESQSPPEIHNHTHIIELPLLPKYPKPPHPMTSSSRPHHHRSPITLPQSPASVEPHRDALPSPLP
ncbi:hypothetical protein M0R45_002283 [Rubus argutus]|uniref:Uncharacterized protein n=1 Tax=Rubus argutus TaxID=59490 RepID=A0AAW1VK02_RUBAR